MAGSGTVRGGRSAASRAAAAEDNSGEGAPVGSGRGGEVCELRKDEAELMVGSARAERVWNGRSTVSFELAGVRVVVAVFWGVEAGSWGTSTRIRMRGSSGCWCNTLI